MKPIRVSTLVGYLEKVVMGDPLFQHITIEGEISSLSRRGRNVYFSLKDEAASVSCADFSGVVSEAFHDGDQVVMTARAVVYKKQGRFQLRPLTLEKAGRGAQLEALEALKKKLWAEGLFDAKNKKKLPAFPRTIGLVTSAEGAVIHDFGNEVASRYRLAHILVAPARVQGTDAPRQIRQALQALGARAAQEHIDVIVVARGGGSSDDLSAFNDETLVRAIAACPLPVVTAIGHQVDTTLSDLASDVRASTPTEAAVFVTPDAFELHQNVDQGMEKLERFFTLHLTKRTARVERIERELDRRAPGQRIAVKKTTLFEAQRALQKAWHERLERSRRTVDQMMKRLATIREQVLVETAWSVSDKAGKPLRAGALQVGQHYVLTAGRYRYGVEVETKEKANGSQGDV